MIKSRVTLVVSFVVIAALGVLAQQAQVADTVVNPLANDPAAAAEGQRTFAATCQSCHGVGAQGDRERGAPALTARGFKHGDGDADLFRTIRSGVPGTQMPSYAALSDQQTWQLVAYIRSLQEAAAATGSPASGTASAAGTTRRRRSGVLRPYRELRLLPRDQRAGRDRRTRPVERRPARRGGDPPEDHRSEHDHRGRRPGRTQRRSRDDRREDPRRQGDPRRTAQRRHLFAADGRCLRPAASARQAGARLGDGREPRR